MIAHVEILYGDQNATVLQRVLDEVVRSALAARS